MLDYSWLILTFWSGLNPWWELGQWLVDSYIYNYAYTIRRIGLMSIQ